MTARILVVDDIIANVRLLESRLLAEYFEVQTATSGREALETLENGPFDIVLLDVMMPGMDGFEVCRQIKANPRTAHIPVIIITALDQTSDRVKGLDSGADDFLTKPVSDVALITRVKSLVRLKLITDELRLRAGQGRGAVEEQVQFIEPKPSEPGRVLIVDDRRSSYERIEKALATDNTVDVESVPQEALFRTAEGRFDLVIISISLEGYDALRLVSQLRSLERTRLLPILLITEPEDNERLLRGLELGVNDYLIRPIDRQELLARVRTQVRRKRYADRLRDNVQMTMEMAVMDSLTGLHNRRYLESHLSTLVQQGIHRHRELAVLLIDIDHFKSINDSWGHDGGDDVLREFAKRLRRNIRGIDLSCRFGGEEFVIVMPDTDRSLGMMVAERLRHKIASEAFTIAGGLRQIEVTISIGLASLDSPGDTPETILKRADVALYKAKNQGRNRVVASEAA